MDIAEQKILAEAAKALTDQGINATAAKASKARERGRKPDGALRIQYGGVETTRPVEIKRYLTPTTVGAIHAQLKQHADQPLLVTDYVTPPLADRLRELGIQFADTAGNAYLQTNKILIWTRGHRRRRQPVEAQPTGRAFEPTGLKIVFALLCDPARVAQPYRALAQQAGVAHGTVGWAMADLATRGFIVQLRAPGQPRRLVHLERLLTQWAEAYARVLRPKLLLARYRTDDETALRKRKGGAGHLLLGGEPAAAQLTGYLKPETFTFYGEALDNRWVLENRLIADPRGNVELFLQFWRFTTPEEAQGLAPLPLVYADLLAIGDPRTLETARQIQEQILDRLER